MYGTSMHLRRLAKLLVFSVFSGLYFACSITLATERFGLRPYESVYEIGATWPLIVCLGLLLKSMFRKQKTSAIDRPPIRTKPTH